MPRLIQNDLDRRIELPHERAPMTGDEYFDWFGSLQVDRLRVELLEGKVVEMSAQNAPHAWAMSQCSRAAFLAYADQTKFSVCISTTIRLNETSAPDPDLMVLPVALGTASKDWPPPLWLLEVSDTSYRKDSRAKVRLYAASGIDDYWILNINTRCLEVYRDPDLIDGIWRYREVTHLASGESVTTINGPATTFAIDDLLPPA